MLGRGHTVSHHSAQKGFDGTENGNGQSRLEHLLHHFETNVWQVRNRETARNVVFHTNGHHAVARNRIIPTEDLHHDGRHDNGNQGARHLRGNLRPKNANGQSHKAHNHSININGIQRRSIKLDFAHSIGRVLRKESQTEEVRNLTKSNNNSDTGGKAHGYRVRDKLNDSAKLGQAKDNQQDTGQKRCRGKAIVTILAHDTVNNHNKSTRRATNLEAGTAQERNGKASDDCRVKTLFRTHARSDCESDGKRERQNAHNQARHEVAYEVLLVVAPADRAEQFRGNGRLDSSKEILDGLFGVNIGHGGLQS